MSHIVTVDFLLPIMLFLSNTAIMWCYNVFYFIFKLKGEGGGGCKNPKTLLSSYFRTLKQCGASYFLALKRFQAGRASS